MKCACRSKPFHETVICILARRAYRIVFFFFFQFYFIRTRIQIDRFSRVERSLCRVSVRVICVSLFPRVNVHRAFVYANTQAAESIFFTCILAPPYSGLGIFLLFCIRLIGVYDSSDLTLVSAHSH